ncbi:alpha/beta hydrolase [Nakamurella multipartita]|jgi:acetyl esterase|uniref:Alpha/beta hydrolase fold-3 domain protein n=1 Tax=Nakamurella multipartita (strain ATCC 700099 / DSM 44233 / CIP 104796 / JCM 9543 / NBRC 105858 / Y-104) TaxID=479431 RepID=C8XJD0_NAKMY|nr:alpha/beta hydrolase [Nakamurella multipartita]ACV78595.1 Alpha/beta hydrolase fold-3 domain protein [Nakamurella multipartita DSM 44233]
MGKLDRRVRAFAWLFAHTPGGSVDTKTPEQIVRAQELLASHGKLTTGVTGKLAKGVVTQDRVIEQDGERVPIRIYRAATQPADSPVVIYFHGGGWALGALDHSDWLCSQVCLGVGAVVVSVDYRLAPVYRFPTAVLDSLAAVTWVATHGDELGADTSRIALMGDSAGGNLAAVACQVFRDRGGPAIAHQSLIYPATDLRTPEDFDAAAPARGDWPILSSAIMMTFRDQYLGPDGDADNPMASPILAPDLAGLPPALIQVAEYDPLRDDGIRYARALQQAGNQVRLTEYVGMPHGYFSFPSVIRGTVRQALAEMCAEQRLALYPTSAPERATRPLPGAVPSTPPQARDTVGHGAVDPVASRPVGDHEIGQNPVPQHHASSAGH